MGPSGCLDACHEACVDVAACPARLDVPKARRASRRAGKGGGSDSVATTGPTSATTQNHQRRHLGGHHVPPRATTRPRLLIGPAR
jgi:hypothetical protein